MAVETSEAFSASAAEELLAARFAATLYIDRADVDLDQPFSEAGLDSILAVEYVTVVRDEFQIAMTVATLYQQQTIRQLARHIAAQAAPAEELGARGGDDGGDARVADVA
ncbi:acyl carrier protein [Catellatospora coxensis]|uniref:Carrier domain-containing protein n=1 Tax=Catellatospora coxensis TaxID=310354 RepID=A0A8J3KR55_9ACTN|nr:acyl carrier protein [Catellatospora coxensis]GIG07133.1 hypothetical protein Cco03nite_38330 [Catellatospora coxensis]